MKASMRVDSVHLRNVEGVKGVEGVEGIEGTCPRHVNSVCPRGALRGC